MTSNMSAKCLPSGLDFNGFTNFTFHMTVTISQHVFKKFRKYQIFAFLATNSTTALNKLAIS